MRRLRLASISIIVCLFAWTHVYRACAAPREPVGAGAIHHGILLKQHFGKVDKFTFYITPTAARVDSSSGEFTVLSHAPDWQVFVLRPLTREMAVVSHRDWCSKYRMHQLSWTATLKNPIASTKFSKDGHPAIRYRFGSTEALGTGYPIQSETIKDAPPDNSPNQTIIECLDYPGCAMTGPIMGRIRGLPPVTGLILSAQRKTVRGTSMGAMITDSVTYDAPIASNSFVVPAGYKTVPFAEHMLETDATRENTESLLKDILPR